MKKKILVTLLVATVLTGTTACGVKTTANVQESTEIITAGVDVGVTEEVETTEYKDVEVQEAEVTEIVVTTETVESADVKKEESTETEEVKSAKETESKSEPVKEESKSQIMETKEEPKSQHIEVKEETETEESKPQSTEVKEEPKSQSIEVKEEPKSQSTETKKEESKSQSTEVKEVETKSESSTYFPPKEEETTEATETSKKTTGPASGGVYKDTVTEEDLTCTSTQNNGTWTSETVPDELLAGGKEGDKITIDGTEYTYDQFGTLYDDNWDEVSGVEQKSAYQDKTNNGADEQLQEYCDNFNNWDGFEFDFDENP